MKIIDANTGHDVKIGVPFRNIDGMVVDRDVQEGWTWAKALISIDGQEAWHDLTVRFTHPGFFGKKVGFINS